MEHSGGNKINYLEGTRGIAAFIVVIQHYLLAFYPALYSGLPQEARLNAALEVFLSGSPFNILFNGSFAIGIFFVLSGYVLSYKFFRNGIVESLSAGALKRYVRLMLPVLFSLLIAYTFMELSVFQNRQVAAFNGTTWLKQWWNFEPDFFVFFSQALWGVIFKHQFTYNSVAWTMTYEFYGSMLIFSFLALFGRARKRAVIYIVAIVLTFNTFYIAFILGILLCDLNVNAGEFLRKFRNPFVAGAILLAGVYLGSYPMGRMFYNTIGPTIYGGIPFSGIIKLIPSFNIIGAFLILLGIELSGFMQKLFSLKPFVYLGRISFSMYLLHFIVLGSFSSFMFLKLQSHMPYGVNFLLTFGVSLLVIWLGSHYMYLFVDRKAIGLSKALYEKVFRPLP